MSPAKPTLASCVALERWRGRQTGSEGYLNDVVEEEMEEAGKGRKKRAFGSIA